MSTSSIVLLGIYIFTVVFSFYLARQIFAMEYKRKRCYRTTPLYLVYVTSCFIPLVNIFNTVWDYTAEKKLYTEFYPDHLTFLDRFVRALLVPQKNS